MTKFDDFQKFVFTSSEAYKEWSKACSFHRGRDKNHSCGNQKACEKRLRNAHSLELAHRGWI